MKDKGIFLVAGYEVIYMAGYVMINFINLMTLSAAWGFIGLSVLSLVLVTADLVKNPEKQLGFAIMQYLITLMIIIFCVTVVARS